MKCHTTLNCILVLAVSSLVVIANGKRGFILTAPKVLKTGTLEHLTLTLFEISKGGHVTIQLLKEHNNDVLAESTVFAKSDHSTWVELLIPNVLYKKAKLRISGSFDLDGGYTIDTKKEVHLEQKSLLTFIQTDKPIYKPGQTVKFRVFPVDIKLEPVDRNTVGDIWITNPSDLRVEQWKNISFATGLIQLSLSLSHEAALGDWSIHSEILGTTEEQQFEVAKYVLPRFEVIATPPPYVLANASTVVWKICARYTYGKQVDGTLRGNTTYGLYQWEKSNKISKPLPFVDFEKPISGCTDVEINTADLVFESHFYSRGLLLNAEVIENGTGTIQNVTDSAVVETEPLKIKILKEKGSFFKPGIPYRGKVQVTTPDGIPAAQEPIMICVKCKIKYSHTKACKNFVSNEDGNIYFTIPPQEDTVTEINVKVEAVHFSGKHLGKLKAPSATVTLSKWFSPSLSYIQIEPSERAFSCEEQEEIKVIYTPTATSPTTTIKFYHQIISRGRIVKQGYHLRTFSASEDKGTWSYDTYIRNNEILPEPKVANGEFILKFDSRAFMSPIARLLVFYVHPSGETIADSQEFMLDNCLPNKVKLTFVQRQQYPGSEASIKIKSYPHSLCGLTIVDKSVHLMKAGKKFTLDKIFSVLKKYDLDENTQPFQLTNEHCDKANTQYTQDGKAKIYPHKDDRQQRIFPRQRPVLAVPEVERGVEDDDLRRRRSVSLSSFQGYDPIGADAMKAFEDAGMVVLSDLTLQTRLCNVYQRMDIYPRMAVPLSLDSRFSNERTVTSFDIYGPPGFGRSDNDISSEPKNKLTTAIRNYFPETWLWELQDMGESGEISLKRNLPHTITEWMGNAICISHQSGLGISEAASIVTFKPFFVSIVLPYSVIRGEKVPIIVKVFNYLSYCLPMLLILETNKEYELINGTNTHKFCICGSESVTHRFMIRPHVLGNITLTVHGYPLEDDQICNGQYTALLSESDSTSRNLLVMAEGFYKEETRTIYLCPKDYPEETFTENITIRLPENLVKGSESTYFSVTGDLMGPSLNGLQKLVRLPVGCGEQNMILFVPNIFVLDYLTAINKASDEEKYTILNNMKTGYQRELNYRHQDGSYSAFGSNDPSGSMWLTAFVVKSFSQARRFIDIDRDDLDLSIEWITEKQLENGCFPTIGKLHHEAMKGGINENQQTFTTLTAYVIICLLESGMSKSSAVIKNAMLCMSSEPNPTSYSLALFSYASSLAGDPSAEDYLHLLREKATHKDGMMYWNSESSESSHSINVETAAYNILSYLQLDGRENIAHALSIIRWIVRSRNANGGFVSTQDTVLALQALAEYATKTSHSNLDMTIVAQGENFEHNFQLNEANKLVTHSLKVPSPPFILHIIASGEGCALIQVHQSYNVKDVPASEAFNLQVTSVRAGTSGCSKPNIRICASYNVIGKASNMAVIEAKIISGYIPDEQSLLLLNEREELALKRHEITNDNVVFYFDELSNNEKCFQFIVIQDFEVDDVMPAVVKLYDYYKQESFVAVNYTVQLECSEELPGINVPLNDTLEPESNEIQQSDIEFVNISALANNNINDDSGKDTEASVSTEKSQDDGNLYDKFTDINHELDFPDGLEGNIPLTVTPPQRIYREPVPPQPIPSKTEELELRQAAPEGPMPPHISLGFTYRNCPLCFTTLPPDFHDVYCTSAFALKVELRNVLTAKMKIIYDFTPRLNRVETINAFAEYYQHPSCACLSVHENVQAGSQFLMIGKKGSLWQSDPKQRVTLNSDVLVIPVPESLKLYRHLREAQNNCREL